MKKIWISFLVVTSLFTVIFSSKAALELVSYFSLNEKAPAGSMAWKVLRKGDSSFALEASYEFNAVKQGEILGATEFSKPYFLNSPSAEKAAFALSQKGWEAYYNRDNPSINSLQKNFPFKTCIQALLTMGVFIYSLFFKKIIGKAVQEW